MQDMRDIYNDVAKTYNLTGSKFIMQTKSTAPTSPSFTPSGTNPPSSTPTQKSTMGPPEDVDD